MKIEKISDIYYKIYICVAIDNEQTLREYVYKQIMYLQKYFNLNGFYKVVVIWKKFGIFLEVNKLEDAFYNDTLDLKIIVSECNKLYFKTDDYFVIEELAKIKYLDGYFYGLIGDDFDYLFEKVEFGNFVFGKDIDSVLSNVCCLVK